MVRKKGKAPLQSTFAVVEEPYGDKPFIDKVEQIALTPQDGQAVAIRIKYGNTVDTVISTLDDLPYPERKTPDGIRFQGLVGHIAPGCR